MQVAAFAGSIREAADQARLAEDSAAIHLKELQDYKASHDGLRFQLNTFGFGYDLDSALLDGLAREGNGTYAFCPVSINRASTYCGVFAMMSGFINGTSKRMLCFSVCSALCWDCRTRLLSVQHL